GFAAIEDRGVVRILPEAEAKLYPSPTRERGEASREGGDRIETRIYPIRHESAAQLVPVLRPLISPNNNIVAYPNTNTLVITDYANNLQRLEKIIESIDQPSGNDPIVIPLQHASAIDVAANVNRLFAETPQAASGEEGAQPAQQQPIVVVADVRSNSLLARSADPARLARLRRFVAMLDSPTSAGGNIH